MIKDNWPSELPYKERSLDDKIKLGILCPVCDGGPLDQKFEDGTLFSVCRTCASEVTNPVEAKANLALSYNNRILRNIQELLKQSAEPYDTACKMLGDFMEKRK